MMAKGGVLAIFCFLIWVLDLQLHAFWDINQRMYLYDKKFYSVNNSFLKSSCIEKMTNNQVGIKHSIF